MRSAAEAYIGKDPAIGNPKHKTFELLAAGSVEGKIALTHS
jgi:hypothetical protein